MKPAFMLASGYQVIEEIGQGGMATVYLAIQESLNRQVALKVLTHTAPPGFSKRFLREARVIASLNHRHVVTIYDVGVEQERHYISMEYLTGGDLRERIARGLSVSMALRITDNIASALQAGHEKGIIHRDVKPANILFRDDGTPLLTDFGVAKQADTSTLVTKTGQILGTPAYLSPEQAHGVPLDGRADMYSLGIVLYEMLTGTRPYKGDSDISTIFKHAYDPLPTLPGEYEYLQTFLDKLLAKSRDHRFEDMAAMRSALREAVRLGPSTRQASSQVSRQASPPQAGRDSGNAGRLDNIRDFLRSYKGAASLAGLVVSVTLILLAYSGPSDNAVGERAAPAQTQAQPGIPEQPPADSEAVTADREDRPAGIVNPDAVGERTVPAQTEVQPSIPEQPPADSEPVTAGREDRPAEVVNPVETEEVWVSSDTNESSDPDPRSRVDGLIAAGNDRLAERKAISPKDDNALYYFRLAEALDPGNPEARQGLYQVASHYAVLANQQIQEQRYVQARQFIDRGLQISPGHPRLRALDRRLQLQSVSRKVKRASKDVLKSLEELTGDVVDKIKEKTDRR